LRGFDQVAGVDSYAGEQIQCRRMITLITILITGTPNPKTGILRNIQNIHNKEQLSKLELYISGFRIQELKDNPVPNYRHIVSIRHSQTSVQGYLHLGRRTQKSRDKQEGKTVLPVVSLQLRHWFH
jgi:hypothetical protein